MGKAESTSSQQPPSGPAADFRRDLLLACQVALLGEVSSYVRAIAVGWTSSDICLRAIVHGPVNDDDLDSMECVASEVIAAFPAYKISVETIRVDMPESLRLNELTAWVYMRKEDKNT